MNVEQAFIKYDEQHKVIDIVDERINGAFKDEHFDLNSDIPDSYESILANDLKRKVSISPAENGWIAVLESNEVNDYTLLIQISQLLQTEVIAVVQADTVGEWGYVEINNGLVTNFYFSEEDDDIEILINKKLCEKRINSQLHLFREAVKFVHLGWRIIKTKKI